MVDDIGNRNAARKLKEPLLQEKMVREKHQHEKFPELILLPSLAFKMRPGDSVDLCFSLLRRTHVFSCLQGHMHFLVCATAGVKKN